MNTKSKIIDVRELEKTYGHLTFGRLLKSHRLGEGLSQIEMAKILKMSKQSLNDLEHGRKIPSIRRAMLIARKIQILDELAVCLVLQEYVFREKLPFIVSINKDKKAS